MRRLIAALMALFLAGAVCLAADKKPVTDDSISDYVRLKLATDPDVKGGALGATAKDGVVTLTGVVETKAQKDKAARIAKKVKGVKQVVNNITLKDRNEK
jgi:osmotically-inducible protein OsmY